MLSGKPASGKTVAIKAIMRALCDGAQRPQFGRVYCSTAMLSGSYTFFPDNCVFTEYNELELKKYIESILTWKKKNAKKSIPPNVLLLDDQAGRFSFYTPFWTWFLSIHRHTMTTFICASQGLTCQGGSSVLLRSVTDISIMYGSPMLHTRKTLFHCYGGYFDSFKSFVAAFESCTKKRGKHWAMVFQAKGENIGECYKAWKAPLVDDFKIKF